MWFQNCLQLNDKLIKIQFSKLHSMETKVYMRRNRLEYVAVALCAHYCIDQLAAPTDLRAFNAQFIIVSVVFFLIPSIHIEAQLILQ